MYKSLFIHAVNTIFLYKTINHMYSIKIIFLLHRLSRDVRTKKTSSHPLSNLYFSYASKLAISTALETHLEKRQVVTILHSGCKFILNTFSHSMSLASSSAVWEAQPAWLPFHSVLPSTCLSLQVGGGFLSLSELCNSGDHTLRFRCFSVHRESFTWLVFCFAASSFLSMMSKYFVFRKKQGQLFSNIQ